MMEAKENHKAQKNLNGYVKLPTGKKYNELRGLVEKYKLNTICT